MRKILLYGLTSLLALLLFSGCARAPKAQANSDEIPVSELEQTLIAEQKEQENAALSKENTASIKNIYERINNISSKDELLKTEYSLESLQKFSRNGNPYYGYAFSIKEIDEKFPIECIRKISEKFYYVVYKVKEGGYLYAFLLNHNETEWKGDSNSLELCNSFYIKDSADIQKIKVGSSFAEVSAADVSLSQNHFNYIVEHIDGVAHYYSVHRAPDGLFLVHYENDTSFDEISRSSVKSLKKQEGFTISPKAFDGTGYEYNYTILDIDQ